MSEFGDIMARDSIAYGVMESGTSAECCMAAVSDRHWLLTEIIEPLRRVLDSGRYVVKEGNRFAVCERTQPVCHGYFDTLTEALSKFKEKHRLREADRLHEAGTETKAASSS
jgi:hypothetical protein